MFFDNREVVLYSECLLLEVSLSIFPSLQDKIAGPSLEGPLILLSFGLYRSVKNKRPMDFYYQNHVGDESFKT